MLKRVLFSLLFLSLIAISTGLIITYSRGYRFNFTQKKIDSTGILSVSSYPDKASIWIDGKLKSASNASISLPPNWYHVKISKEGYRSWEKRILIQKEEVSQIDALLIPNNPSMRALTVTGVSKPTISPSGTRVAYMIPPESATSSSTLQERTGVWILDLKDRPLGGKSLPRQIFKPAFQQAKQYDWDDAKLLWSPDEKQIILLFPDSAAFQLSTDGEEKIPTIITSIYPEIIAQWDILSKEKQNSQIADLPISLANFLTTASAGIRFAPDDTKILYQATTSARLSIIITPPIIGGNSTNDTRTIEKGKYYVYDIKEDKNFFIVDKETITGSNTPVWFSDSKHILMIEKDIIYIIDYDGTNKRAVYTGPFEKDVLFQWPPGGKIVILTNLNKSKTLPNLYEVDLR